MTVLILSAPAGARIAPNHIIGESLTAVLVSVISLYGFAWAGRATSARSTTAATYSFKVSVMLLSMVEGQFAIGIIIRESPHAISRTISANGFDNTW